MTLFISRMGREKDGGRTGSGTIALSGNLTFSRPDENWELGEMGDRHRRVTTGLLVSVPASASPSLAERQKAENGKCEKVGNSNCPQRR